jgi:hypothetical protein
MNFPRFHFSTLRALAALALMAGPLLARGDCSLTTTGNVPLPGLGPGTSKGFEGGLYPNGNNVRPPIHDAAGLVIASQILPLDSSADCGGKGIRTPGLLIANETLYQLSYTPLSHSTAKT